MFFLQLKVVVWKNLIIRKRHWLLTIVESVLPILLFLIIAYIMSELCDRRQVGTVDAQYNRPKIVKYGNLSGTTIYYAPNTTFYQDIMKKVQFKFQMANNDIKGFPSGDPLLHNYNSHNNVISAAIIFYGNEKNLDYTIRMKSDFYSGYLDTAQLYSSSFQIYSELGTQYSDKYLSIQKALDMSFIEKISGRNLDNNITIKIQEFPYPSHQSNSFADEIFLDFLPVFTLISFIFISPAVLKRVVEEKYSGIKELMKMVGMKSWMLWLGWVIHGLIPMLLSVFCIVLLMKLPFFNKCSAIIYTDGSILFVFLLLYCVAAIVFCFAISSFFSRPTIAMVAGILIWILSYFLPKYGLGLDQTSNRFSWSSNMLLNLLPNMALHYGYLTISLYEERNLGLQWNNFYESSSGGTDDVTMLNVFLMLIIDVIIYMAFTLYMDIVNPGKYGVRKSFLFPIYFLLHLLKRSTTVEGEQGTEPLCMDYVEEGRGLTKGIEIQDLVKRYGPKLAVNNLTLNIYKNQITVLLGHNGAGKSTTMSIITGMLNMTSGSIKMNGKDISYHMDEIRKSLGLCPQHNLLFTDLTVGEHLLFFAKLKGKTAEAAENEMLELLEKLHLSDKTNSMASTLSGGMKRKLCLAMAIIGGSEILILDEPTSGMDPESRRELWNLLLAWRGEKTILITTHFMEEADALGDWIAIMANGRLQCHGTPMYLKKTFDTGYHLSLIVKDSATAKERTLIKNHVTKHMQSAELKESDGNNMVFLLPLEDNAKIADLLSFLEVKKEELQIENMSVTVTTLEDVFLKVKLKSDVDSNNVSPFNIQALLGDVPDDMDVTTSTVKLYVMRINALIIKKLQFYRKKILSYLVPTLIALLIMILTVYLSSSTIDDFERENPDLKLQLSAYKHTTVFYSGTKHVKFVTRVKSAFRSLVEANAGKAVEVEDVQKEIVNKGVENIVYYKKHLVVGAEFYSEKVIEATALYSTVAIHSAPISLNLITNAIAKAYLGDEYSITTSNWPLQTINSVTTREYFSVDLVRLLWPVLMPIGFVLVIGSFIVFPHMELSTKFTQLQYMCGVKPYCYWLVTYLVDFGLYLIICTAMAAVPLLMAPYTGGTEYPPVVGIMVATVGTVPQIIVVFQDVNRDGSVTVKCSKHGSIAIVIPTTGVILLLIFAVYGAANLPFLYLFSRKKTASGGFAAFVIIGIIFGIILTIIFECLMIVGEAHHKKLGHGLKILFILVLPQVGLVHSIFAFSGKAVENYNKDKECMSNRNPDSPLKCEIRESYFPLLKEDIILLVSCSAIYTIINILLDTYFLKRCVSKVRYQIYDIWYKYILGRHDGIDDYQSLINSEYDENYNSLRAKDLRKTYAGKLIVKNIGFTLNEKECLGILGVNGAGKTTTFRMLTRDEVADSGSVHIISNKEKKPITITQDKYLENLGYCPQMDSLNFVLTGRQILALIARLRGVDNSEVVNKFLKLFELERYADMPCGHYSGGNKRKLSLAVALIGYPKFVLLDEPTNGVDPSSRRKFWNLIKNFKHNKDLSFILTSHSMAECEALCNNLKIMKDGRFEKEGTISELKKEHGGFNVKLKLVNRDQINLATEQTPHQSSSRNLTGYNTFNDIEELKGYFTEKYNGVVKDEHSGLLHIYIEDRSKKWSTMFKEVEQMKTRNPHLIEDYSISEASLEDIFLTVARSKNEEEEEPKKKTKKKEEKINSV